jgi:hypothetical protein
MSNHEYILEDPDILLKIPLQFTAELDEEDTKNI